ncbi:MAG: DNA polymerase III subunit delta [Pseudohongiellaceae bacterium]
MKLTPEKLASALKNEQFPMVWLSGDEPLLIQEAADSVRGHYRKLGFEEREILYVDSNFKWEQFRQSIGNLSLFASQRIIELRLSSSKLDDAGKAALEHYLDNASAEYLVLIISPRIEGAAMKSKWFSAIESRTAVVRVWPIAREQLGRWLERRLRQSGIHADKEAVVLLMDRVEGNLLAAIQEIEKLKLLAGTEPDAAIQLDAKTVMQAVADSSRFNAYHTVDAALLGDAARTQHTLHSLRAEGTFPLVILGAVNREIRNLLPMIEQRDQGEPIASVMKSRFIMFNRKQAVGAALERLQIGDIRALLEHARLIDQAIKGMSDANPWDELSLLLLRLSGVRPVTSLAS